MFYYGVYYGVFVGVFCSLAGVYVIVPEIKRLRQNRKLKAMQAAFAEQSKEDEARKQTDILNSITVTINTIALNLLEAKDQLNKQQEPPVDNSATYLQALAGLAAANTHLLENQQKEIKLLEAIVSVLNNKQ